MIQQPDVVTREPSHVSRWRQALRRSWLFNPPRMPDVAPTPRVPARLRFLAFVFGFFGAMGLLMIAVSTLLDGPPRDIHVNGEPRTLLSLVVSLLGMLVTAWGLNRRSRSAALGAAAVFIIPAITQLFSGKPFAVDLFGVVAVAVIASVWKELE